MLRETWRYLMTDTRVRKYIQEGFVGVSVSLWFVGTPSSNDFLIKVSRGLLKSGDLTGMYILQCIMYNVHV